jgi:hypothetical protein
MSGSVLPFIGFPPSVVRIPGEVGHRFRNEVSH